MESQASVTEDELEDSRPESPNSLLSVIDTQNRTITHRTELAL